MTTQVIERMSVEIDGDGDAVICVHGLGGSSNTFQPQMGALAGRRVVRPDLLCSGRSPLVDRPSIPDFVAALARMAGVLGIGGAVLIGHSMGTIVAQHLAAAHARLVRKMILLGPLIEPLDGARDGLKKRAHAARMDGLSGIADQIVLGGTSGDTKSRNPAGTAFVRESVMRQSPEGYARSCEALASAYAADHSLIKCPTLLIAGEEDQTAPPSVARALAERIAGAKVAILPRCGHWLTVERSEEVNREIRHFL